MSLSGSGDITPEVNSVCTKRTEGFFQKIYQHVATGIAITDWQGVFQECNPAYCALLGYTEEELRTIDFASLIHPEDREANLVQVSRLQVGEIPSFDIENRYIHKNGEPVWVHKFVSVLYGKEGEPTHLIALVTNITERKLADDVRLRHTAIVESSDDAIMGLDANGTVVNWNKGAERLYGYPAKEAIGRNIFFLSMAEDPHDIPNILKRVLSGEVLRNYETVRLRKDGAHVEVSLTLSPIIDARGAIVGVSGIARDITERKRAEVALSRHSAFVESCEDAIISKTLDGIIQSWNTAAERILGYTETEAIGQPMTIIVPSELQDEEKRILERLGAGERIEQYETVRVTKAGKKVNVSLTVSPLKDSTGRVVGAYKIVRDITERKQLEKALRESEERFRSLYENSTLGLYRTTPDGKILLANPSLVKMLGFSSFSELAQRNLEERGFEPSYERAEFQHRLATEGEVRGLEASWTRRDGTAIFVRESAKAIRDAEGKITYYEGTVEDITERKRAEEALRQSEEKFLKLFRGSPVAVALSSVKDGRLIEVNNAFEGFFGYRHEEVIGSRVSDIGIWVDPTQREKLTKRLRSERSVRDLELRFRTKNGGIRTCLVSAELIEVRNEPCILSVTSDITERKLAEEALRTSEERFRLAALAGKMFAYEWDAATDVILRSADFAKILGSDEPLETTGQKILARIHPDDRERVKAAVAALSPENPSLQISYRMLRRNGTIIWVERNSHAHFDDQGRMVRIVGMVKDVTERNRAEEALHTSEEWLRLAQKVARIGSFEWDVQTGVNIWTPELEALYGLAPGGFGKTEAAFENLVHPDDRGRVIEWADEALKTGLPNTGEWRVIWPDGSVHWIAGRWQAFMNESGQAMRMIGVNIDVTDQKRAQEEISSITRKLVEAQEQERARIARELHDDINQRVGLLAIELDQLRLKHNDLPAEVRARMHQLLQQASEIATDLHGLSHELHSSKVDRLGIVRAMTGWCKEFGDRHKLTINFKSQQVPKLSQEISICLFRVLQEAVNNAAKHSDAKRIEVQLVENSGEIHLNVSDSGRGFDIGAAGQSQGLGLTSMQERVRLIGGKIAIESQPTGGTTIHVRVRLESEHRSQRAAAV